MFISGRSGVGKSFTVDSLRQNTDDNTTTFYLVSGKFGQYIRREPFSAISAAFGKRVHLLQQHKDTNEFKSSLLVALSPDEIQILGSFVADLQAFLGSSNDAQQEFTLRQYQAFDVFKMIFQKFFRVASSVATFCIFLDDIQLG